MFLQIISLIVGLLLVGTTFFSAIETFVLPRSAPDQNHTGSFPFNPVAVYAQDALQPQFSGT